MARHLRDGDATKNGGRGNRDTRDRREHRIGKYGCHAKTGKDAFEAIIDSAASRLMPVAMAAATTILGMIPLFFDDFFAAMAVTK